MSSESEFIHAEIEEVRHIVRDECWLEAERRGMPVDPSDEVVQNRVAEIILSGVGERLRQSLQPPATPESPEPPAAAESKSAS